MPPKGVGIVWFEIPVDDLDRAAKFYEAVLETELSMKDAGGMEMAWFPMVEGVHGVIGSLVKAEGYKPSLTATVVYFDVDDIEGTLAKIASHGGKTLMPKTSIGEWGFIAHFQDSEGNRVALHSMK